MVRPTFLVRALATPEETYAEKIVRINRKRLMDDPDCLESQRKSRKWSSKLIKERRK